MTRFARGKGSKASNERTPEDATSWTVMKQQLLEKNKEIEENKLRCEVINQRNNSYKAFLADKEEEESKYSKWADFPGITKTDMKKNGGKNTKKNLETKKVLNNNLLLKSPDDQFSQLKLEIDKVLDKSNTKENSDSDCPPDEETSRQKVASPKINKKKVKVKKLKILVDNHIRNDKQKNGENMQVREKKFKKNVSESNNKVNIEENRTEKKLTEQDLKKIERKKQERIKQREKRKKMKAELRSQKETELERQSDQTNTENNNVNNISKQKKEDAIRLKQLRKEMISKGLPRSEIDIALKIERRKAENKVNIEENRTEKKLTEQDLKKIERKKQKRIKQMEKRKKMKAELKSQKETELGRQSDQTNTENNNVNNISKHIKAEGFGSNRRNKLSNLDETKKTSKYRDKKEHPRKKPLLRHKMFINGKVVEVDYVEGFPVKKEDAIRLKQLRKEMISKGLPRSEIDIALKLERRKAEKSFAREKKKVCFNCRKSGHNLSDCPELSKNQVAATVGCGICFKCGSTEHTHFECKVVRGQNFNYAQCFICNEQGHIARQCPDNPKGLYPKGGGCKVCGDVTHLKKDCPKYQAQQLIEEDKFKIETLGSNNPDVLEEKGGNIVRVENKKLHKIIQF